MMVCCGHFGEVFQGRAPDGVVALVTAPCPGFRAVARFAPGPGALRVVGRGETRLALAAARRALGAERGGSLRLVCNAPQGGGVGSSTLSVLATLRAVRGVRADEAALCAAIEGACDPAMLDDPGGALWASREGRVLEVAPGLPPCWIAGGFDGPPQRTDPADGRFAEIADLIAAWRAARGDLAALAAIASESAARNQALRPKSRFRDVAALARGAGALGLIAAHTGPALGLIFAPEARPDAIRAARALTALGLTGARVRRAGAVGEAGAMS